MKMRFQLILIFLVSLLAAALGLKPGECEVCVGTLDKIAQAIPDSDKNNAGAIDKHIRAFCKKAIEKENRFCYYVGATEDAASSLMKDVITPLSTGVPTDLICQRLKKKDEQICSLRYDRKIDLDKEDINTLKVRDLKKILHELGGECNGCSEKSEFIREINRMRKKEL